MGIEMEDDDLDLFKSEIDGFDDFDEFMSYEEESEEEIEVHRGPTDVENIDQIDKQAEFLKKQQELHAMREDLDLMQHKIFPEKKNYRSLILERFSPELCIELEKIARTLSVDNNTKMALISEKLSEYGVPFSKLGGGTNRYGIMIDGYAVKIAYDRDGMIDNKREFIYSLALQPYVVKTYECNETGLISVCEYVMSFTENDIADRQNQAKMREILKEISSQFFIGDVGIATKNYGNWGIRRDTGELVILDYAYIYIVGFKQFQCSCAGQGILYYDREFNNLICPICGKKYTFRQLRKKISRKDQDEEIGKISERGYVIHEPNEQLPFNHHFVLDATNTIRKRIEKEEKRQERLALYEAQKRKSVTEEVDDGYHMSIDEIINENK